MKEIELLKEEYWHPISARTTNFEMIVSERLNKILDKTIDTLEHSNLNSAVYLLEAEIRKLGKSKEDKQLMNLLEIIIKKL